MADEDDSDEDAPAIGDTDGAPDDRHAADVSGERHAEGEREDEASERTEIECSLGALSVAVRTPHDDAEQLFERV